MKPPRRPSVPLPVGEGSKTDHAKANSQRDAAQLKTLCLNDCKGSNPGTGAILEQPVNTPKLGGWHLRLHSIAQPARQLMLGESSAEVKASADLCLCAAPEGRIEQLRCYGPSDSCGAWVPVHLGRD